MTKIKGCVQQWVCARQVCVYLALLPLLISTGEASIESLQYEVQEEHDAGMSIGNILYDAELATELPPDVITSLRFNLLSDNGDVTSEHPYLAIHQTTGQLTSKVRIDRDVICPGLEDCLIEAEVAVSPALFFRVIDVQIEILDINDNVPTFPQRTVNVEIPESSPLESTFSLPLAVDIDSPRYGISEYVAENGQGAFDVSAAAGALALGLVVTAGLDRETTPGYLLSVLAKDGMAGGGTRHTSTLLVNVTVTDANDNHPIFDSPSYTASVVENTEMPQSVVTVHASDADIGMNSRIIYGLAPVTIRRYGNLFEVHASTGAITLTQAVDRESQSSFSLTVTARDSGANSRLVTATVDVSVRDVNDNAPAIRVSTLTSDGQPAISDSSVAGTFVVLLSVSDPDEGVNGFVSCRSNHPLFGVERISDNKFQVKSRSSVDRGAGSIYNVTVTCRDDGSHALTSQANFNVKVVAANDFTPYFSQNPYAVDLDENTPVGTSVINVNATDRDSGANGRISFSLTGPHARFFRIGDSDGIITVYREVDFERTPRLELVVVASDAGDPPLSASATVSITVIDMNDQAPIFKVRADTVVVTENQPPMQLRHMRAVDNDTAPYNIITYSLQSMTNANESMFDTSPSGIFSIDPETSIISTLVELDREETPVYYLEVVARNAGYTGMSSTASLTVFVADENDNAPIIDFPNSTNRTVFISSLVTMGDIVTQVRAHDLDTGLNGEMTFDLINVNVEDEGLIMVDPTSGLVYVNSDLSHFVYKKIETRVRVSDRGESTLISERDLTVVVDQSININDVINQHIDNGRADEDSDRTMLAIICVVGVSGVLICILLVAIVFVLLRSRRGTCCSAVSSSTSTSPGKDFMADGSIPAEIEWESRCHGGDKVLYKTPLKQTNTRGDRPCHAEMDNSVNVLKNNSVEGQGVDLTSHVPHTRCHEMGISYVPNATNSNKRKRGYNRTLPQHGKPQEPPPRALDLTADLDTSSASSGEMSNADSGRGASEEGERSAQGYYVPRGINHLSSNQGSTYPRLTTFKSPPQPYPRSTSAMRNNAPSADSLTSPPMNIPLGGDGQNTSPTDNQAANISDGSSSPDNVSTVSSLPRLTGRNMKNKHRGLRQGEDPTNRHDGSYSLLNNMLANNDDNRRHPGYNFNDANSLLKYKANSRLSETGSEITDATSTTSGSYALDTDDSDSNTVICAHKDVDV